MYRQITATDLAARIGSEDPPFVLDVRNPDEHEAWKIATSVNIPVTELADRLGELPAGTELVVHCAAGARSAQAAAVLVDAGFDVAELSRSEEHTSELQSLMRNSYAVFCLKKKTN